MGLIKRSYLNLRQMGLPWHEVGDNMKALIVYTGEIPDIIDNPEVELIHFTTFIRNVSVINKKSHLVVIAVNINNKDFTRLISQRSSIESVPFLVSNSEHSSVVNCLGNLTNVGAFLEDFLKAVSAIGLKTSPAVFFSRVSEAVMKHGEFI